MATNDDNDNDDVNGGDDNKTSFEKTHFFWNEYFNKEKEKVEEWIIDHKLIEPIFTELLQKDEKILFVGCGSSLQGYDLHNEGYEYILNTDISEVIIENMKVYYNTKLRDNNNNNANNNDNNDNNEENEFKESEKNEKKRFIDWRISDCTNMKEMEDESINIVIDKGTSDTLQFRTKSNIRNLQLISMFNEVSRILSPSNDHDHHRDGDDDDNKEGDFVNKERGIFCIITPRKRIPLICDDFQEFGFSFHHSFYLILKEKNSFNVVTRPQFNHKPFQTSSSISSSNHQTINDENHFSDFSDMNNNNNNNNNDDDDDDKKKKEKKNKKKQHIPKKLRSPSVYIHLFFKLNNEKIEKSEFERRLLQIKYPKILHALNATNQFNHTQVVTYDNSVISDLPIETHRLINKSQPNKQSFTQQLKSSLQNSTVDLISVHSLHHLNEILKCDYCFDDGGDGAGDDDDGLKNSFKLKYACYSHLSLIEQNCRSCNRVFDLNDELKNDDFVILFAKIVKKRLTGKRIVFYSVVDCDTDVINQLPFHIYDNQFVSYEPNNVGLNENGEKEEFQIMVCANVISSLDEFSANRFVFRGNNIMCVGVIRRNKKGNLIMHAYRLLLLNFVN